MKRSNLAIIALSILLSGSLLLGLSGELQAQPFGGHRGGPGRGFFSSLTDEQSEIVREMIEEMRDDGAGREEIHAAVAELLSEWGIEMPERTDGHDGPRGPKGPRACIGGPGEMMADLTNDQRAVLRSTALDSWKAGATSEEIHDQIKELLEGFGVDLPEDPPGRHGREGFGRGHLGHMAQLTDEQRTEIHEMVADMRDQGATHDEVRAAVEQKLAEWGIELPELPPELTTEQRATLHAVVFELWLGGATGQEIHSAAAEQFEIFGLQMPEHGRGHFGMGPFKHLHKCLKPELTHEQRETVHQAIREMREEGADPEEIHQAIRAMLEDLGVDLPDLSAFTDEERATLRSMALDLWLAGAPMAEICDAIRDLLDDFGIQWPEDADDVDPAQAPAAAPIRAQNYPNPANPETQISYTLGVSDQVRVQIFNISGQQVRAFDMGYQSPGTYSVKWDGRHQSGQPVASGVYFYQIQAGPHMVTNRMVLLK